MFYFKCIILLKNNIPTKTDKCPTFFSFLNTFCKAIILLEILTLSFSSQACLNVFRAARLLAPLGSASFYRWGRFHLLRESQAGCGSFRNTTLAGCYVEIAPIWNVIKVVWLLASGLGRWGEYILFIFFSSQMKMYSRFCWEIPGGESRLLNICNTACTVELKWVLRWVIHCGFPSDISKVCSFWTVVLL